MNKKEAILAEKVLLLRKNKFSINNICKELNVQKEDVMTIIYKNLDLIYSKDFNNTKKSTCKLNKLKSEIFKLAKKNIATAEIAKSLDLNYTTVKTILLSNGFEIIRKESNSKSKKFESQIMDLIHKNLSAANISKKLNIHTTTIKKIARANGIDIDERTLRAKKERNELIYKLLLSGEKYQDIADKMNVSKARIEQVAKKYNYKRWDESKKKYELLTEQITNDFNAGATYETLEKKYNLNNKTFYSRLQYHGLPGDLLRQCKIKRNEKIAAEYKSGKKAIDIINSKNKNVIQPNRISSLSSIYNICSKNGVYKYPKVGRRIDGGSFEDFEVLRLVKHLKEDKKFTFEAIAKHLNSKKFKTVCGKKFNMANARFKYFDALKSGL